VKEQVQIETKYEGYIARQKGEIDRLARMEGRVLSPDLDYMAIAELRGEAREKLAKVRPGSFGQARRIAGVSPADLAVLMVHVERTRRS